MGQRCFRQFHWWLVQSQELASTRMLAVLYSLCLPINAALQPAATYKSLWQTVKSPSTITVTTITVGCQDLQARRLPSPHCQNVFSCSCSCASVCRCKCPPVRRPIAPRLLPGPFSHDRFIFCAVYMREPMHVALIKYALISPNSLLPLTAITSFTVPSLLSHSHAHGGSQALYRVCIAGRVHAAWLPAGVR